MAGTEQLEEDRVLNDLLDKIANGVYEVDAKIPSTKELVANYGVSSTPIRAAVKRLQQQGVLAGKPGSGVIVKRKPTDIEAAVARGVGDQLAHLAGEVQRVADQVDQINPDLAALKAQVGELQAQIMDLYAKGGYTSPYQQPATNPGRKVRSA